jgi:phosphoglycerate dehydrogenase-like enzyme
MKKVLFIWDVKKELREHFMEQLDTNHLNLVFPDKDDEEFYLKHAPDTDVIVGWRPSKELLKAATKLTLFANPGAGVQHLMDLKDSFNDCTIINGHGNAFFTAEHIMAMVLSVTNQLIPHHQWMLEGKWRLGDQEAKSISLRHRKIGLLGYGNVNKAVHKMLEPFGAAINIYKRNPSKNQFGKNQLHDFLKATDLLIIALPLTSETENLIGKNELELLGEQGIIINAGRGKIVNETALYQALKTKSIAAAGIDVWYDYDVESDEAGKKFPYSHPFYELDNVLLSPHRAASPFDDIDRWDDIIFNINCVAKGNQEFINIVDLEAGY